jgi:ElaB/YqjD/DUF883 family membrane-anchored ribosome-binding protein
MGSYDAQAGNKETQGMGGAIDRLGPLAEQVKGKVSDVADRASGALSDVADRASGALSEAKERGSEAASNAGDVIGALRNAVTETARTQPGTTVLLSIAAGFLLGAMWKSGR